MPAGPIVGVRMNLLRNLHSPAWRLLTRSFCRHKSPTTNAERRGEVGAPRTNFGKPFTPGAGATITSYQTASSLRPAILLFVSTLLLLRLDTFRVWALPILSSNQLVFANVDHAPMGACGTITYGYKGDICGEGTETGVYPYWAPSGGGGGGVLIALSNSAGLQILPFVGSASSISSKAQFFPDSGVQRKLTPCTDEFTIAGAGLRFTHYTPIWSMPNLSTATLSETKRYFLPATWLVFTVQNTNNTPEDFYFGLPVPVTPRSFGNGAYQGFGLVNSAYYGSQLSEAAMAVQSGSCEVLSGSSLSSVFSGMTQGAAFHLAVPAGQIRSLTVVIGYYRSAVLDTRTQASYYYTSLFSSIDNVFDAAFAGLGDVQTRCQELAAIMAAAGLNPYRQFLACHAIHSYMADTACTIDPQGNVSWREIEGIFNFINTFDLTVDHSFFDSFFQPWALRNVLDTFSGAIPGTGYFFTLPLVDPSNKQVSSQGFSFYHDMGLWPTSQTHPAYGGSMGDEELQSWILSAGQYWSHSSDDAWLTNNLGVLQTCLSSMLLRDHTNAPSRDGVTKNVNSGEREITTFDNLDGSLQHPAFNGRLAVRNWACYLALNAMFTRIGDATDAATCENMAGVTAQTIVDRWNTYHSTLGYIPALLDGSSSSAVISMVEGLVYPAAMGLTNAIDRTGGPYASMLQALSNHVMAVLVPGRTLDSGSGAWLVTSSTPFTWQSKVFLSQYATEAILGITNSTVDGAVDQVHVSVQFYGAPFQGFCDAFQGYGALEGGHHYPRGVTSVLWWLNPTNDLSNPVATSVPLAPGLSAEAGDQQVLLLWQGVAFAAGYNLGRATVSGGPYTPVTNGLAGASFIDSGLKNGTTYYYVLTATNQFGQSAASPEVAAAPSGPVSSSLSATLGPSGVTIAWPSAYIGWILQTNNVGPATKAAWGDVPGSGSTSQMIFPAGAPGNAEFFRLRQP